MSKNKLFYKVLSVLSAVSMTFAGGISGACVRAVSCEEMVKACFPESIFGKDAKPLGEDEDDGSADALPIEVRRAWASMYEVWVPVRDSGELGFTNYGGLLGKMRENPNINKLLTEYERDRGCKDSVVFLSLLYFIDSLQGSFNKKAIIKGLVSLRSKAELRDDRFIVTRFDSITGSGLKNALPKGGRR